MLVYYVYIKPRKQWIWTYGCDSAMWSKVTPRTTVEEGGGEAGPCNPLSSAHHCHFSLACISTINCITCTRLPSAHGVTWGFFAALGESKSPALIPAPLKDYFYPVCRLFRFRCPEAALSPPYSSTWCLEFSHVMRLVPRTPHSAVSSSREHSKTRWTSLLNVKMMKINWVWRLLIC